MTEARKRKGLTQEALGKGLGTDGKDASKAVVYGWEKDQHFPKADQLVLICEKLDESADYLLLGRRPAASMPADISDLVRDIAALPTERQRNFVITTARQALETLAELTAEQNGLPRQQETTPNVLVPRTKQRKG